MSNANGVVSRLPINISDPKAAMAHNSNDLGTLCKSDSVNLFAKYKPLRFTSGSTQPVAIQCDNSSFSYYYANLWKGDKREEGNKNSGYTYENGLKIPTLFQTSYTGTSDVSQVPGSGGVQYPYLFTFKAQGPVIKGNTSRSTWDAIFTGSTYSTWRTTEWNRDLPNVYRLSDFANYDNNCGELFTINWPSGITLNANQKAFEIRGSVNNRDNANGLTPSDFDYIKNLCLKIGNYEVRNTFSGNNTIDFYVQKPVWSGKTSITAYLYSRGVDDNNYAKYMGCKFRTNSVVQKTIPITILGNQYKLATEFGFISPDPNESSIVGMSCSSSNAIPIVSAHTQFYRSGFWIDDEHKGACWKVLRLQNYYWRCYLMEATGQAQAARPQKDITFQCLLFDEDYDSVGVVAPPVILGEYTTHYNASAGEANYKGYWWTHTSRQSGDASKVRFLDDENNAIWNLSAEENKYLPILSEYSNAQGTYERYTKEQNIAVRLRVRFRVVIDGAVFGTLDVPINGDAHSYGYIWDNTQVPSNRQTQLPVMDGGVGLEIYTGTTSTACTMIASDHGGAVQIRDKDNPIAYNNVDGYCTSNLNSTTGEEFFHNAFIGDDDFEDFNTQIHTDTTEDEIDYINWQLD